MPTRSSHYQDALKFNPDDHENARYPNFMHQQGNGETSMALYEQILQDEPKAIWALNIS